MIPLSNLNISIIVLLKFPFLISSLSSSRPDCFISSESDKYLTSQPYETYEEMMLRLDYDGKARIIQRNYRIYKLLKYIKEYARQYRELANNCRIYKEDKLMMYKYVHFLFLAQFMLLL